MKANDPETRRGGYSLPVPPTPTGDRRLLEMTRSELSKPRQGNPHLSLVSETMGVSQQDWSLIQRTSDGAKKAGDSALHQHSLPGNIRMMLQFNTHKKTGSQRCGNSPGSPSWELADRRWDS